MQLVKQFIFSFIAVIGFAGYFNVKQKPALIATALSGSLSFVVLNLFDYYGNNILGTFVSALLIGVAGELLSVKLKTPSTVFITPGIIPLVPGAGMYYTMFHFVNKNFTQMINVGANTIFSAGSIALGILVGSIFSHSVRRMRRYNLK